MGNYDFKRMINDVILGNVASVKNHVHDAIDKGIDIMEIVDFGLLKAMNEVGDRFEKNEIYVTELLVSARAVHAGLDEIRPLMTENELPYAGKIVIGTVAGDLHDIGKNLVAMMIESAGFEVIDLGVDVPIDKIIAAVNENPDVKIVALSALLTTTMPSLRDTVAALNAAPFRSNIKVMVGGAPITQAFADEIGADGYSEDAASAATLAKSLAK